MLKKMRQRRLATANRTQMLDRRLDNITRLVEQIRALPKNASAQELTSRLLREAEDADGRARCADELAAKAS